MRILKYILFIFILISLIACGTDENKTVKKGHQRASLPSVLGGDIL